MTTKELSARMKVPYNTLYNLIADGKFPAPDKVQGKNKHYSQKQLNVIMKHEWARERFPCLLDLQLKA